MVCLRKKKAGASSAVDLYTEISVLALQIVRCCLNDVKHVFDVSQTTSRNQPQPAIKVEDRQLLKALIHKAPVSIQGVDELPNNMGAFYDHDQKAIFVRRGMDAHDIFRSLSKELAHWH